MRNEHVTELIPKLDLAKRADFEGEKKAPPKKIEKLEKELKKLQKDEGFKSVESKFDEEHNLWEVEFRQQAWRGARHQLGTGFQRRVPPDDREVQADRALHGAAVCGRDACEGCHRRVRMATARMPKANPPRLTKAEKKAAQDCESAKEVEVVEKTNVRDLRDYVINEGRKEFTIQRYKGLGEMTAPQLWETTMDPERRTLLSVKLEDIAECETIFTTLMGEDVEARRKFIEENALDVKNLDI